jgi:hypothetical protein
MMTDTAHLRIAAWGKPTRPVAPLPSPVWVHPEAARLLLEAFTAAEEGQGS